MSQKLDTSPAAIGIDIGKNSFHIVGQNQRGAIVLRQKWSRGQVEARLANLPPCLIGTPLASLSRAGQEHGRSIPLADVPCHLVHTVGVTPELL
jgi:transposase